jgi:hypothetical protein
VTETILLLTEDALTTADAERITDLHADEDVRYRALVPADTEQNLLVSIVDHLSLGELREALDAALGREEKPEAARRTAAEQLAVTLAELHRAGATAEGEVVEDDPLPALRTAVAAGGVREVVVVTRPHAVEDTFHTDWASRAREVLEVPVMHLYSGTNLLG